MQLVLHGFDLVRLEPGAVSSLAMVEQCGKSSFFVGARPVEQTALRAGADVKDLRNRVSRTIQADG
jgi:hypothetical protein